MKNSDKPGNGPAEPVTPTCGNCSNSLPHPDPTRLLVRICTALPPQPTRISPTHMQNIYPEMDPGKLGCTALWGVRFEMLHAVTMVAHATLEQARLDGQAAPGN